MRRVEDCLASEPEGGDGKPGGVYKLSVLRRVEFEGITNVDFIGRLLRTQEEWANAGVPGSREYAENQ